MYTNTLQPIPTAADWRTQYLEAIGEAFNQHATFGTPANNLQLMMTVTGRQALVQALGETGDPARFRNERYLNMPVVQYNMLQGGADWCIVAYYPPGETRLLPIRGCVPLGYRLLPYARHEAAAPHTSAPGPLLDAIYKAMAVHADSRHRVEDLRLYVTEPCQLALVVEAGAAKDSLPMPWRIKPGNEDGDWSLYYRDPTSHELRHGISGNMHGYGPASAPAPDACILIPTREEYEAEAPPGTGSWERRIGALVAAALEGPGENLPEFWRDPQVCEAHPHLPFPHGTIRGVPTAGCSGPGMPAPSNLRPGQPAPTRIVLQVVGKVGGQ